MEGGIAARVREVRSRIEAACGRSGRAPGSVTLIAVSKGFGAEQIREAAACGITDMGENRVQEAEPKVGALGDLPGVTWHMLGHLQTNKVRGALRLFDIIHSVDSLHLAEAIARRASARVPVFVEVNVANEPTKSGFGLDDLRAAWPAVRALSELQVLGFMTVAPLADEPEAVRPVFRRLRAEAEALGLPNLSMGMTDDFEVAIEEGATHVRIGRAIFGERER